MSLEDYLGDEYSRDQQDIRDIEQVLERVAATFLKSYVKQVRCWPYELRSRQVSPEGKDSAGTTAMISAALGKMLGHCTFRGNIPSDRQSFLADDGQLDEVFKEAVHALTKSLKKKRSFVSGTFGNDNPLTMSHLTDLARGLRPKSEGNALEAAIATLKKAREKLDKFVKAGPAESVEGRNGLSAEWAKKSAFIALRVLRAHVDIDPRKKPPLSFRQFFESQLHEQLSFSTIPDSRFDPAELSYALEGLLICARETVDPFLFERVLAVLASTQETSAYWRPNRPFYFHSTGTMVLPLSVEGANSLLRSVDMMDVDKLHGGITAKAVPLFRRFWQWLRARKVEFQALRVLCVGWHSEHINEPGVIHLWDTSQVVEFLLGFRRLLRRHIARETLVRSRVKVDEPKFLNAWSEVVRTYEPAKGSQKGTRVFDQVEADFVLPWKEGKPKNYSMMVYGPPGTGKTTIARSIANALKCRLLTISVGDFLGAGGALVEARAKAIFQMLEAQYDSVVLFDEIDAFLLDRNSDHYRQQDTLFQFLTPGMLTKINDLRKTKRLIFIIATNYENRIDPAIKRAGRIDKNYLLLPPDLAKRKEIIRDSSPAELSLTQANQLAKAALYLGYEEIVGALKLHSATTSFEDMSASLTSATRSSHPEMYFTRLGKESFPTEELLAMIKLAKEAGRIQEVNNSIRRFDAKQRNAFAILLSQSPVFKSDLLNQGIEL